MTILTLQRRARELGRIRLGHVTRSGNRSRPEKLDRFRLTSHSRELLDKVAELYGGEVSEWTPQNGGPQQWEVLTDTTKLPILVPPQPVTQHFELWSGGGCDRRCDGVTELLSDAPCLCDPDPAQRDCQPTTRLNVVLRDVEGIGVWRLESHGYYAAVELPEVADLLARAQGYLPADLRLEERVVKRNKQTRRFLVPTLEVQGVTPGQLLDGATAGNQAALTGAAPEPASPAEPAALPASAQDPDSFRTAIAAADSIEAVRELWSDARSAEVLTPELEAELRARADELTAQHPAAPSADDPDALWNQVLATVPASWSTEATENHFAETTGVDAGAATAADMQTYLDAVKGA